MSSAPLQARSWVRGVSLTVFRSFFMTLSTFVTKSAFRNKRRTILTIVSIALSFTLLTFMMTIWRAFYIDTGSEQSTQRLITRHRVSLTFSLPIYYRQKMATVPGVVEKVRETRWRVINQIGRAHV